MPRAIVLGGNGQVGRAAALRLVRAGWEVNSSGQTETRFPQDLRDAGVRFIRSDRYAPEDLRQLFHDGADVVVDCAARLTAAVGWLTPRPPRASSRYGRPSSTRLTNTHSRGRMPPTPWMREGRRTLTAIPESSRMRSAATLLAPYPSRELLVEFCAARPATASSTALTLVRRTASRSPGSSPRTWRTLGTRFFSTQPHPRISAITRGTRCRPSFLTLRLRSGSDSSLQVAMRKRSRQRSTGSSTQRGPATSPGCCHHQTTRTSGPSSTTPERMRGWTDDPTTPICDDRLCGDEEVAVT
ncbi:MAG: NAD-dependent epimerase/dehydratase family protein [Actinobacteria bacterium]|nr:NAD-dependent epimerase/dehydratase family protein [Actinomycetota bacterium]